MSNFWEKLPVPLMVLAPMEDVTDPIFRQVVANYLPNPDVFFTEFTSSDGLASPLGYEKTVERFKFKSNQRPIVAQIWGVNPEHMEGAASIARKLKFDGIDINMGCPDKSVMKVGAGAAMCTNPKLAAEIINSVRKGAKDIPVSVKTRLGTSKIITEEWIGFLLEQNLPVLTVHGRTAKQKSDVPANWDEIGVSVNLKNKISPKTILVGNGDIKSYRETLEVHKRYKVDGAMIGRGIFSNPWAFEKTNEPSVHTKKELLSLLLKHVDLFEKEGNPRKFNSMKKFFKIYVSNFPNAAELRQTLMNAKDVQTIRTLMPQLD